MKRLSSRTSAHAGVAIPIKLAECCLKSEGIATALRPQARFERNRRKAAALSARCGALPRNDTVIW